MTIAERIKALQIKQAKVDVLAAAKKNLEAAKLALKKARGK